MALRIFCVFLFHYPQILKLSSSHGRAFFWFCQHRQPVNQRHYSKNTCHLLEAAVPLQLNMRFSINWFTQCKGKQWLWVLRLKWVKAAFRPVWFFCLQVELLGEGNLQSQTDHLCEHQELSKGPSALGELSEQRKEGLQGLQGQTRSKRFEVTMHWTCTSGYLSMEITAPRMLWVGREL